MVVAEEGGEVPYSPASRFDRGDGGTDRSRTIERAGRKESKRLKARLLPYVWMLWPAGYGVSRTRMAREIKAEKVKVNWKLVTNPAHKVAAGDVLSIRGRGRVIVAEVGGKPEKDEIRVVMKRLLSEWKEEMEEASVNVHPN